MAEKVRITVTLEVGEHRVTASKEVDRKEADESVAPLVEWMKQWHLLAAGRPTEGAK